MNKVIEFTIDQQENGLPIKTVLSQKMGLSRREISRLKFTNGLYVNGEICRVTQIVQTDDQVKLIFPEKDTSHAIRIIGKPDILYEDEDLVIVNKPAGMVCHPSREHQEDDMGTLLQNYYGGNFVVRPIGRLDKDVSGIMVYAKNQLCASRLTNQRKKDIFHKEYLALIKGNFEKVHDTLQYDLIKDGKNLRRRVKTGGQQCTTHYWVEKTFSDYQLVKIAIETGRTHQIRAGMSYYKHPLLGDKLYDGPRDKIDRPALHCAHITFNQPFTNQVIDVYCEPPHDMQKLIQDKTTV